jgi:hypothetical protein
VNSIEARLSAAQEFPFGLLSHLHGRPKLKAFTDACAWSLPNQARIPETLQQIASKLIAMAVSRDLQAMKEIAYRLEGKVPQAQVIQGDEDRVSFAFLRLPFPVNKGRTRR